MLAQPACVAQPSETCRATSHDIGGISGGGKLKMSFRSLTRHSLPERQAVPPESQTEHSSAKSATSKSVSEDDNKSNGRNDTSVWYGPAGSSRSSRPVQPSLEDRVDQWCQSCSAVLISEPSDRFRLRGIRMNGAANFFKSKLIGHGQRDF